MIVNEVYKILERFLIALGFEVVNSSDEIIVWKQHIKSISYQIDKKNNRKSYLNESIKRFNKLAKDNFSSQELQNLLINFNKGNKISFIRKGNTKILKINKSFEKELEIKILSYLIPKKTKYDHLEYTTPIEFSKLLIENIKKNFKKNLDKEITSFTKNLE